MTEAKSLNPNLTFLGFSLATKRPQAQGGEGTHKWFPHGNRWHGDTPLAERSRVITVFVAY
jgi:hypothetical protein